MPSFIETVLKVAAEVKTSRSELNVLAHTMEEVGELAEEITIYMGNSYKDPGVDGVYGEAVDAIITLVDLLYTHATSKGEVITEQQLIEIANKKLEKWRKTATEIRSAQ